MKILYISQYFPPEVAAPANRVSELSRAWAAAGHDVTVLTGFPNHPTGKLHPAYVKRWRRLAMREEWHGVKVVRTFLIPLPNRRSWERVLNYVSFMLSAALAGPFLRKPDVVIATSPQLLVGLAGRWTALVRRTPFVFEVRDLWPDAILQSGVGKEGSLFARVLEAISRYLYRRADLNVVVTSAFERVLRTDYGIDPSKLTVIENGVDIEPFEEAAPFVDRWDVGDRFVVSFMGTIGLAHGLQTVLDAAELLRETEPDVVFVIAGEGAELETLRRRAAESGASNVIFTGGLDRNEVFSFLGRADVALVLLKDVHVFRTVLPTKLLEAMAAGLPIVLGVKGQALEILEAAEAGIGITPESAAELAEAVVKLKAEPELRARLGTSGRDFIKKNLTRAESARRYLVELEKVVAAK